MGMLESNLFEYARSIFRDFQAPPWGKYKSIFSIILSLSNIVSHMIIEVSDLIFSLKDKCSNVWQCL